jgi:hypothetical protein
METNNKTIAEIYIEDEECGKRTFLVVPNIGDTIVLEDTDVFSYKDEFKTNKFKVIERVLFTNEDFEYGGVAQESRVIVLELEPIHK